MTENYSDLTEIIRKIENQSILLPDFQREFVWRDEEQQKKIVASVLARMPIGSILLLKSQPDEYSSKIIGCKTRIDSEKLGKEVEFLLDGQQRITVLANVFSDIIHKQCRTIKDLISPTLKRRFFLRIPRWINSQEETDLFGVHDLQFTYKRPNADEPSFLSGDILPFIECIPFLTGDGLPFNPQKELSVDLDGFCLTYNKGYLIPLYLLVPLDNSNRDQCVQRYDAITKKIPESIGDEIKNYFAGLSDNDEKSRFIDEIFKDSAKRDKIKNDYSQFNTEIEGRVRVWIYDLNAYLTACVNNVALNGIVVKEEQRARAIDIYENLNRGGVSLNTFDLIMARVAKVSKTNYYQRMIKNMQEDRAYDKAVLPDTIKKIFVKQSANNKYNATINTECYNESKNEIAPKYIDAFLDVLSLYCYNPDSNPDEYKIENIKREQILRLHPEEIDQNTEKVCTAIDRALYFFQTRCGIRFIQELNYSLMLVLVATVFVQDDFYADKTVHDRLEAWYWSSLFSGEYDKDQNVKMINHLQSIVKTIKEQKNTDWISSIKNNVLEAQNFSDEAFLLMEKVDEDRYPKLVLRSFMCQYLLSKTYADMFDASNRISVFYEKAKDLEAHHIIPLGTAAKINESTAALRKDKKHICNSPLNFVYITKEANKEISDEPLSSYVKKLCDEAKSSLYLGSYDNESAANDAGIKTLLRFRYSSLKTNIKEHIDNLLV